MNPSFLKPLALGICLLPAFASAQELQPGLWEISSQNMQVDGKQLPDMQQMLGQLKNMPPEQRQMMEQMLAQQGVQLGDQGVRICISAEQIAAKKFAMPEMEAGCSHEIIERSAQQWRFTYSCPGSQGEGLTRFPKNKEFISQIKGTQGGQSSSMESRGRWIAADCGGVAPQ
jgi:hypothetical protein